MENLILAYAVGFASGYMVCSIFRNREKKSKEKIPFKEGI